MTKQVKGALLAICGALLWGIQGPISQYLFQQTVVSTEWLMGIKMLVSGIILAVFTIWKFGWKEFKAPLQNFKDTSQLLAYALFGITLVQYMYFLTIKYSDAGIATILQSLGTIIIIILSIFIYKKLPTKQEFFAVVVALIGTWLLVTKSGELFQVGLSPKTLIFGFLLALAGALQTMLPVSLLKKYKSFTLLSYAMIIGGIIFTCIHPFWRNIPNLTLPVILGVLFIVFFGTALAYICFTSSLQYISATKAGLLDAFEPAAATLGAFIFLHTSFDVNQVIGGIFVISTVFILAFPNKKKELK